MKKVLHIIKEYTGNQPLLNECVKALPGSGFYSIVCYLSGRRDGNNMIESFARDVRYLEMSRKSLKQLGPGVIFDCYRIMRSEKIDIVHCHRHRATVIGTIAAALAGVPHVLVHVHGLSRTRTKKRYWTNWIIFKKVERIIAVSDSVKQDVIDSNRNIPPEKVVTVRNGLDLAVIDSINFSRDDARSRLGIPDSDFVFGTVGRLSPTKGQTYLIDAFSDVIKHIPNAKLIIVGQGPLSTELREKASELGLSQCTVFTGFRKDVHEILRGFDVFVLPSVAEGLSIALLEAMASKLPVIASRVGGIPEVIDNSCGLLVPARESGSLAKAMEQMVHLDPAGRTRMGEAARKRIEKYFTAEIMDRKLSELYESLSV